MKTIVWLALYVAQAVLPRRPRFSVLVYHSISEEKDFFAVSPELFDRQMRYIRDRYEIAALGDALEYLKGKPLRKDTVAITFDDGYLDFTDNALPILEKYRLPATVFVIAGAASNAQVGNAQPRIAGDALRSFGDSLVSIGSHTLTHRKLPRLSEEDALRELEGSRIAIRGATGTFPQYVAYPKGAFNARVCELAEQAGYQGGFTVQERSVRRPDSPYAIPRIQIDSSTSWSRFRAKLTRAQDWYYVLWKLLRRDATMRTI